MPTRKNGLDCGHQRPALDQQRGRHSGSGDFRAVYPAQDRKDGSASGRRAPASKLYRYHASTQGSRAKRGWQKSRHACCCSRLGARALFGSLWQCGIWSRWHLAVNGRSGDGQACRTNGIRTSRASAWGDGVETARNQHKSQNSMPVCAHPTICRTLDATLPFLFSVFVF